MAQPVFLVRFDLRNPSFAGVTYAQRCAAALDMAQWADEHGAAAIVVSEHHGSDDGYLPSALTMAAAVAARTSRCTIYVSAIPAPLHDPVQLAEQVAVVEHLSGGRLVVVLANGYVPSELAMFDVEPRDRPRLLTEAVDVLRAARTGEPFEHRGRTIRITPAVGAPGRKGPPIVLGGSSDAAARRAARIADGFQPSDEGAWETYRHLRVEAGRRDPGPFVPDAGFVHLATDVEAGWATIGPYVRHDAESYARWAEEAGIDATPAYRRTSDDLMADIRARDLQRVMTPTQLLASLDEDPTRLVVLNPMVGGLPPELAWASLRLFEAEVLGVGNRSAPLPQRRGPMGWVDQIRIPSRVLTSTPFRTVAPAVLPRVHRAVHRLSGGRLLDTSANPMCLLVTTGAKTGQLRETPLAAVPVEEGRLVVVGSNFAAEHHPAWTTNLLADPHATVTFRGHTYPVDARLLTGEERAARWAELVAWYPNWDVYTHVTGREFRVFELARARRTPSSTGHPPTA